LHKTVLVGNGYWGSKIHEKLLKVSDVLSVQSSKNYNPNLFENADWVFVATPIASHYDIVKDCIIKGINVFVEKPFASSVAKASELIELAKKK
jgi:virulence factor